MDKALIAKYTVLGFGVVNSLLNLFGYPTIPDEDINTIGKALGIVITGVYLLRIRAHEMKCAKDHNEKGECL